MFFRHITLFTVWFLLFELADWQSIGFTITSVTSVDELYWNGVREADRSDCGGALLILGERRRRVPVASDYVGMPYYQKAFDRDRAAQFLRGKVSSCGDVAAAHARHRNSRPVRLCCGHRRSPVASA
jgi:hypothetical protein